MIATAKFAIEPLGKHHDRAAFSCGVESLDQYLKSLAGQDDRRNLSRTFVLVGEEPQVISGYYSVSTTSIDLGAMPDALAKKLPGYSIVPAAIIGRLAVDTRYRGHGRGGLLLVDAIRQIVDAGSVVAAHAIVVDAIDAAAISFYEKYGFRKFPTIPNRLFLPVATAKQLFND